jgi:hypothetical protein
MHGLAQIEEMKNMSAYNILAEKPQEKLVIGTSRGDG